VEVRSRQNRFREQLTTNPRRRPGEEGDQLLRRKRRRALSTPSSRDDNIVFELTSHHNIA
jgi:hypothetical protein